MPVLTIRVLTFLLEGTSACTLAKMITSVVIVFQVANKDSYKNAEAKQYGFSSYRTLKTEACVYI